MNKNNRTYKSIRNSIFALLGQFVTIGLNFISRTVFIHTLGATYLGINGLFTNLLTVLSFAELGFSTAIIYEMYGPLAMDEKKQVAGLMNLYGKIYRYIGICIFIVGLFLIPFLNSFIKDTSVIPKDLPPLWFIYVLFLANTSASYFFNYKRSIIVASQNGHLDSLNQMIFNIIRNTLQIAVLLLFESFILFLVIQLACTFFSNVSITLKANKLFPYLKDLKNEKVSQSILKSIKKNVFAMAFNKLGSVTVSGIDNLLMSKYVGVISVGYYSNYLLIITTIKTLFIQLFSPITASVGNFVVNKSNDEMYFFFKKLLFINAYLAIFSTVCLATLINSFIGLFWGDIYIFSTTLTFAIILNFYIDRIRQTSQIFIDVKGLFWQIKWRSFTEAVVNILLSMLFLKIGFGLKGILYAILLTNLCVNFWWEPYIVFKNIFHKTIWIYFAWHLKYIIILAVSYFVTKYMTSYIPDTYIGFFLKVIISIIIPNIIIIIAYYNTIEFKYFFNMIKNNIPKHKKYLK